MKLENLGTYSALKWLRLDGGINGYRFVTDGSNIDETCKTDAYTFGGRLSSRFYFLGFNVSSLLEYHAPRKTVQGTRKSMISINLG